MNLRPTPGVDVTLTLTTKQVFLGALISTVGCALQGGAVNLAMLAVGRAIAGVAVGILSGVIPMYCAEIATADQAKYFLDMGVQHFSVGTDITILHQWWKSQGEDLRKALGH